jgi:hypothetical protein
MIKDIILALGLVLAVALAVFGLSYGGYEMYAFFKPRYVAVDNATFKESQQYNDGMIRDLENLQMEYNSAGPEQKQALRAIILHRFSVYPLEKMPLSLRNFYDQVRGQQ